MPFQSLVEYSILDDFQPFLLVVKDKKVLERFIEIANIHYDGNVPTGAAIIEYECEVPDISNYKIVKISHEGI